MSIWFTSDQHFYHKRIIEICDRPFVNEEQMRAELIKRHNQTVKKSDKVFFLGDFMLGKDKQNLEMIVKSLNGHKTLILGNHDDLKVKDYYAAGFDFVSKYPVIINKYYMLSHAPLFLTPAMPYYNVFGHVHNDMRYETETSHSLCVCVERHDYRPCKVKGL